MKKIFTIVSVLLLIISLPVSADEDYADAGGLTDIMKYTNTVESGFGGQKQITDEEFKKTLEQVKAKQKKKKNKNIPKGKNLNEEDGGSHIDEILQKNLILSIPLRLKNGDGTEIPAGHYKITGEKKDKNVYLNFYQSSTLVAKVPAIETQNDFGKMDVNFVELQPYNEQRVRIIYGSIDFNAYTFINIEKSISDIN